MTARRGGREGLALALFAALAPPIAWSVQLWTLALIGDLPCREGAGASLLGIPVAAWWVVVSVAAAVGALAGLVAGVVTWRRSGGLVQPDPPSVNGPVRFLGFLGILSGALFLATIVMGATSPAWVACA